LEIRTFVESDEKAVIALWSRCGLLRPWNDPRKDIARKLRVQRELFLVGILDGVVVATVMAGYDGHRGWINYLAVDPGHRRIGLGSSLMMEAERRLRELGCPKINLQVRRENIEGNAFYSDIGFTEDDVVSYGKRLERDEPTGG
jgi:ribosomal protein S18 acetylase RimI-like enzyme